MRHPKASILMATYNRENLIKRAIESVQSQTFKDWELLVIDDGSTDNTAAVVKEFQRNDRRINYVFSGHIGRISKVSNIGLKQAQGEYIAVLDDDDSWIDSEKLSKQVEFFDGNPEYVGCGGGAIAVDKNSQELFKFLKPEKDAEIRKRALYANPMINSTTMFRRSVAEKIGFYDESLAQFADWDFWLKMGTRGKLYNFPEYFLYYRVWESGSSFKYQKENARAARRIICRHRRNYTGFASALILTYLYGIYAYLPPLIKKFLNPFLSRLKKNFVSQED